MARQKEWPEVLGKVHTNAKSVGKGTTLSNSVLKIGEEIVQLTKAHSVPMTQSEIEKMLRLHDIGHQEKGVFLITEHHAECCSALLLKDDSPWQLFFLFNQNIRMKFPPYQGIAMRIDKKFNPLFSDGKLKKLNSQLFSTIERKIEKILSKQDRVLGKKSEIFLLMEELDLIG